MFLLVQIPHSQEQHTNVEDSSFNKIMLAPLAYCNKYQVAVCLYTTDDKWTGINFDKSVVNCGYNFDVSDVCINFMPAMK